MIHKLKQHVSGLLADDQPEDEIYDPVQVAVVLVSCMVGLGALYWMLWAVLVCEGGLVAKIGPALQVLFTGRTLMDFGYQGHPYQLGLFEGWIVNVGGLAACLLTLVAAWFFYGRISRQFPLNQNPN